MLPAGGLSSFILSRELQFFGHSWGDEDFFWGGEGGLWGWVHESSVGMLRQNASSYLPSAKYYFVVV